MASEQTTSVWERYADIVLDLALTDLNPDSGDPIRDAVTRRLGTSPKTLKVKKTLATHLEAQAEELDTLVTNPSEPFGFLSWNAELDAASFSVLAVLAAVELNDERQHVAQVIGGTRRGDVTVGMLRRLFGDPGVATVLGDGSLVRSCLVEPIEDVGPWTQHIVRLAPPIAALLAGSPVRDAALPHDSRVLWETDTKADGDPFVLVTGGDRLSRQQRAMERCRGNRFLICPIPKTDSEWRATIRHCVAFGASAVLETATDLDATSRTWIDRGPIPFAICSASQLRLDTLPQRPFVEFTITTTNGVDAESGHFIDPEQRRLAETALASVGYDFDAAVRRVATGHLDSLAVRTAPGRSWNELVLPQDQIAQLRELVDRYRHRSVVYKEWGFAARPSTGVTALFAGPSGTGKTMTAEIVATDLGLDLYRVDLSSVVSKYIGETEKNLESLFTASSAGNIVLFFDEADALFGKRTEVSDARDRYANIETSYLLQRLERYEGVVILATNLRNNIDQAFLRRVDLSVDFDMPDKEHRARIWHVVFPQNAPIDNVDIELLASEFEMAGGSIRNAAVHAAFLAAASESPITMDLVLTGVQREFQKEGRLRSQTDETIAAIRGEMHVPATR